MGKHRRFLKEIRSGYIMPGRRGAMPRFREDWPGGANGENADDIDSMFLKRKGRP